MYLAVACGAESGGISSPSMPDKAWASLRLHSASSWSKDRSCRRRQDFGIAAIEVCEPGDLG